MSGSLLEFYREHVQEVILPFWKKAVDKKKGGIYTCFNNEGDKLLNTNKYTWSQGRFIWLWSEVVRMIGEGKLEGDRKNYLANLHKSIDFVEENVFLENGNCVYLLAEDGQKKKSSHSEVYDSSIYADCFIALGLAKYAHLTRNSERFAKVVELYTRIRERIKKGTFKTEPYPIPAGYKAHAIPMIMLNLSQEMAETAQDLQHPFADTLLRYSLEYMKEIMEGFCDENDRIIEILPEDQSKGVETILNRHLNPGHAIESMWFVLHTAEREGVPKYTRQAVKAIEYAIRIGWDKYYGGLLRFSDLGGGKPRGQKEGHAYEKLITDSWDMKLWWPHAEALYATLLAYDITGDQAIFDLYKKIERYVFDVFPNPDTEIGEWIQIRDRKGIPIDEIAALPVKDPFHILRSLLLIIDLLESKQESNSDIEH
ncbi:AGE family epimerase/isomerase [Aliifodinibius sp. S!AR15-10]|uniref:AGE family epimerase/isomerase n=1 Tax=Aliifodinibius sp. S!AR15-10 TaxID=2950437 RepID=UPI002861B74E|nr:AGE family epimerase/isomerase [Aliifodinibius sp. S!AR15-10]MDR8390060.1 AGE family epimerase/isomerase [Aliifodinibius sp. S!AR15-10]